ncbi:amidohydrolase [Neorhizobium galegae]|uniref:amidohydrolase n=1 Tax=Neorhizobium galegae TaxID=399 RepID=UPI00062252A8|nr:amidohydrolase [Neorhizobium galegae]CDZ29066.1 Putative TIM-barrel fold metal-dependent hydrolase [Neorhizobium galegae bv. officinalis]MCQ1769652.1 amidohydrolase [Neorhizobium galegae]MCQ1776451.1 amidohydrolase [Neorhizobium galegae]MCQ1798698.1 amidohydrolase [Neorhizobium galegae]MCQ1849597.1 amidohydrolase [Neorhizobium galegae]
MIRKILIASLLTISSFSAVQAQTTQGQSGADLIVFNAKIFTGNRAQPEASALAVTKGRIYSVGSDADILGLKNSETKVIDARSRRLIPGIIDAHIHVLNDLAYNYNIRWDGVPTLRRALTMLSEQAARTPEGQWVKVIGGWSPYQFEENRFPTLDELEKAVPDRPLIVQYAYNQAFLNKRGMDALGVGTDRFPKVPDTEIEMDSRGNPTGVIHGYTWLFLALEMVVPQPTFDEQVSSMISSIHGLNRFGVTSVIDNGGRWPYPEAQARVAVLARDNRLNVRMPFVDLQLGDGGPVNMVDLHIEAVMKTAPIGVGQNLHPTLDHGHEYRGAGEVLSGEVHDHENFDRPAVIIEPEKMKRFVEQDVRKLVERRIPFRMHTTYNENITPFLDALAKVNETIPLDGLKWSLEHAETISPENIERVKKLGGGIALDTKMALHGDGFIKTHGRDKALHTPRLRMLVDSGMPLAMTTDAFRAATFNPWVGISWMVSGKSVSGSEVLAYDNRLSRTEALKLFTTGAAWFMKTESEMGQIAPGNLADFAVLDRDYFSVPEDQIKSVSSVLTVMGGRVVFGAQDYSALSPKLPAILPAWSPVGYFGSYYGEK